MMPYKDSFRPEITKLKDLAILNMLVAAQQCMNSGFPSFSPYGGSVNGTADKRNPSAGEGSAEKPVILVAEDDQTCRLYLEMILRKTNATLYYAGNGREAVESCQQHPDISLVLMDIRMPVMDGLQATREIKSFRKELPVIAVSAFALYNNEQWILDAGCDDFLAKPVSRDDLLDKLKCWGLQ